VIRASVSNSGEEPFAGVVQVSISDEDGAALHTDAVRVELQPNETREISVSWSTPDFASDLYKVKLDLATSHGELIDTSITGFYAWNEQTVKRGTQVYAWRGGVLRQVLPARHGSAGHRA